MAPVAADQWEDADQDGWVDVHGTLSVADTARARLASRGLTPEEVKAHPAEAMRPKWGDVDSGIHEIIGEVTGRPYDDGSGYVYAPRTEDRGFVGEGLAQLNPKEILTNMVRSERDRLNRLRNGEMSPADVAPLLPDFAGIAKESYRRGEQGESHAGMYGSLAGNVALSELLAAPGRLIGKAPGKIAAAEAAYKEAITSPETAPLAESLASKMMDRRVVFDDPVALSKKAESAAGKATAAREVIPPAKASELGDPATLARGKQRRALADEAKFQSDLQTIADSIPERKTAKNILKDNAKMAAKGFGLDTAAAIIPGASHLAIPGIIMEGIATIKTLYELPKTTLWRTASAVAKREFNAALAKGNHALAANIGAGIATGAFATDDFGHRAAINALAEESNAVAPSVRNQVIASKRGFYANPDGRVIEIPRNVMSALHGSVMVTETDSPVAFWLGEMKKQGKIKAGGTLSFGSSPEDAAAKVRHGGDNGSAADSMARTRMPLGTDFPSAANVLDENHELLLTTPPTLLLPEHFKNARAVTMAVPLHGDIGDMPELRNMPSAQGADGITGVKIDPRDPSGFLRSNTALVSKEAKDFASVYSHEVAHTIQKKDITDAQRAQWRDMHAAIRAEIVKAAQQATAGLPRNSDAAREAMTAAVSRFPAAILTYLDAPDHSWTELAGQYMANPSALKKEFPSLYGYMRSIFRGREYIQAPDKRHQPLDGAKGKPALEYPGAFARQ